MGWWRETIDIVKENDPAAQHHFGGFADLSRCQGLGGPPSFAFSLEAWLQTTGSYAQSVFGASGLKLRFIQVPRLIQVSLSTTDLAW